MKASYLSPACVVHPLSLNFSMLLSGGNSWEDSIQGTGSSWGGLDKDDADFGL
jgi:hypothetical protein